MIPPNPTLWSIWPELDIVAKLCILILVPVGFYILVSDIIILARLRSLTKSHPSEYPATLSRTVARLVATANNLQKLLGATFYLFGFMLFKSFPWAFFTIETSNRPASMIIQNNFVAQFSVASNAFLMFLVLYCVQWYVSGRVRAFDLRLSIPL